MKAASVRRTVKELAVIFLLVVAAAVPLIAAIMAAIMWIESGSPWAGPTVTAILAAALIPGAVHAIRSARR
jgi:hypothetical protein